ncbi:MAG: response regulator [Clostridia bacterium]|nr:response regulator [Clostridia bacterium]
MKLLIVDDSNVIVQMALSIVESYHLADDVTTASSGEACLEIVKKNYYDVILLDVVMHELSGLDVLKVLNDTGILKRTKVIVFTSLTDKRTLKESFDLGAADYIHKPIEPVEFVARLKSVIRQKYLEESLRDQFHKMSDKNRELKELYEALRKTQVQMISREKLIGIGQLAAGIAHEINNPLGYVNSNLNSLEAYFRTYTSYCESIENRILEICHEETLASIRNYKGEFIEDVIDDFPVLFEDMKDGIARIKDVVNGIRFFSRIDASERIEAVSFKEIIDNIMVLTEISRAGIETQVTLSGECPVECIVDDINQSILNIVVNSIHAMSHESCHVKELQITAWQEGDRMVCEIADTGIGISEKHLKDVYNPFFTTKEVGEGSGLGLSIVYEVIVNKHHGDIRMTSQENHGTKVTFQLPLKFQGNRDEKSAIGGDQI